MAKIDAALDDIVKQNKQARRNKNFGKNRGGSGSPRKNRSMTMPNGNGRRSFNGGRGGFRGNSNNSNFGLRSRSLLSRSRSTDNLRRSDDGITRLSVRNLDYAVNDKDMRELFNEFGGLKRAEVHYDRDGRSQGTAELTFTTKRSALGAKKQYNGVPLDGRAMEIEIIGDKFVPQLIKQAIRDRNTFQKRGNFNNRRGNFNRNNNNKGGKREEKKQPTAEELDKELDNYLTAGAKDE